MLIFAFLMTSHLGQGIITLDLRHNNQQNLNTQIAVGDYLQIILDQNPSTGYRWVSLIELQ